MSTGPNESLNTTFSNKENASLMQEEKKIESFFSPFFHNEKKSPLASHQDLFLNEDTEMRHNQNLIQPPLNVVIDLNSFSEDEELYFTCELDKKEDNNIFNFINCPHENTNFGNYEKVINLDDTHQEIKFAISKINLNCLNSQEDLIYETQRKIKKLKNNFFVNFFKNSAVEDLPKYENLIKFMNKEKDYFKLKEIFKKFDENFVFNLIFYYFTLNDKLNEIINPLLSINKNREYKNKPNTSDNFSIKKDKNYFRPQNFLDLERRIQSVKLNSQEKDLTNRTKKQIKTKTKERRERSRENSKNKNQCDESILIDQKIKEIKDCVRKIKKMGYFNKLQDIVGITRAMSISKSLEEDKDQKIQLLAGSKYNVFYKIQKKEDSFEEYKMSYKVYKREKPNKSEDY